MLFAEQSYTEKPQLLPGKASSIIESALEYSLENRGGSSIRCRASPQDKESRFVQYCHSLPDHAQDGAQVSQIDYHH